MEHFVAEVYMVSSAPPRFRIFPLVERRKLAFALGIVSEFCRFRGQRKWSYLDHDCI